MRLLIAATVVAFAAGASGCAGTSGASYGAKAKNLPGDTDYAYVQRVEQIAKHRGVDVEWVNPPKVDRQRGNVRTLKRDDG